MDALTYVLKTGRYRGKTLAQVCAVDVPYLIWLASQDHVRATRPHLPELIWEALLAFKASGASTSVPRTLH